MKSKGRCTPCEISASLGLAFGVCSVELKKQVDCKDLEEQLESGKLDKKGLFEQLVGAAEKAGKPEVAKDIRQAAKFIHIQV